MRLDRTFAALKEMKPKYEAERKGKDGDSMALSTNGAFGQLLNDVMTSVALLGPPGASFFYFNDRYGVMWEFESGREVKYNNIAGVANLFAL